MLSNCLEEQLHVRVYVVPQTQSGNSLELSVQGTASECLRQVEFKTLFMIPQAYLGFRLLLDANSPSNDKVCATPVHFYEASTWGSCLLELKVELLYGKSDSIKQHACWIHNAATCIQRQWRHFICPQETRVLLNEMLGTLCSKGLRAPNILQLKHAANNSSCLWLRNQHHLCLAFAYAVCQSRTQMDSWSNKSFAWLESELATFIAICAHEFVEQLQCIEDSCCTSELVNSAVSQLMMQLGKVMPWLEDETFLKHAHGIAERILTWHATKRDRNRGACTMLVTMLRSEIIGFVLDFAAQAIEDLKFKFHDAQLARRIQHAEEYQLACSRLGALKLSQRSFFIRLENQLGSSLLVALGPGENFGSVYRTACAYYNLKHVQLSRAENSTRGEHIIQIDSTSKGLALHSAGLYLRVAVQPYKPKEGTFEHVVLEMAKRVASNFSVDRDSRVVSFWQQPAHAAAEIQRYSIIVPSNMKYHTRYYHVYGHAERRIMTAVTNVQTILDWVQKSSHKGLRELERSRQVQEEEPANMLSELQMMHHNATRWAASSWDVVLRRWFCSDGPAASFLSCMVGEIGPLDETKELKEFEKQRASYFLWGTREETNNASQLPPSSAEDNESCDSNQVVTRSYLRDPPNLTCFLRPALLALGVKHAPMYASSHDFQVAVRRVLDIRADRVLLAPAQSNTNDSWGAASVLGLSLLACRWLGPSGSVLGALCGTLLTCAINTWKAQPEILAFKSMEHYHVSWDIHNHDSLLTYTRRHVKRLDALLVTMAIQVLLRTLSHAEIGEHYSFIAVLRDLRSSLALWTYCQGLLRVLDSCQDKFGGALGHMCWICGNFRAPFMIAAVGIADYTLKTYGYITGEIDSQQLELDSIRTLSSTIAGIMSCLLGNALHIPLSAQVALACSCSHIADIFAFEMLRQGKLRKAIVQLRRHACEVKGLDVRYNEKELRRRWQVLAKMSHADRNTSPDADAHFAMFFLCRQVLQDGLVEL